MAVANYSKYLIRLSDALAAVRTSLLCSSRSVTLLSVKLNPRCVNDKVYI